MIQNQTRKFLDLLARESDPKHNFCCYNKLDPSKQPRTSYETLDEGAASLEALNKDGYDVYVTVNKVLSTQRKKGNVKRIRAVWIDDDTAREEHRTDFPISPSIITETSPGKFHYYWLTDSTEFKEFDKVMNWLVANYGGDNGAKDLSRVLRVPGYINQKSRTGHECKLISSDGVEYPWEKVVEAFRPAVAESDPAPVVQRPWHVSLDYDAALAAMSNVGNQHFYEPLRSLALSLANRNMCSNDIQKTLRNILDELSEDLRTTGWYTYGTADHIEKFADSAVEIIIAEGQSDAIDDLSAEDILSLTMKEVERHSFVFPPGLAGTLTKDFSEMTVHGGMENLCVMMTFGAIAGVAGRHVTVNNMHTNLYLAYTKTSGAGKSTAARCIEKLYKASNRGNVDNSRMFLGASTATGPKGKMYEMKEKPCNISIVDEAGALGTMSSGEQGALRGLKLNLFNVAIGQTAGGGAYSNKNDNIPVVKDPAASYLSISTHDSYIKFINDTDAQESGELARTLTHADKTPKGKLKRDATRMEFTDEVVDRFSLLFSAGLKFQDEDEVDFLKFAPEGKHWDQSDIWGEKEQEMLSTGDIAKSTAYSRAFEISLRISTLLTHFNKGNDAKGRIGDEEWDYTVCFVNDVIKGLDDVFLPSVTSDLLSIFMINVIPVIKRLIRRACNGGYKTQQCSYFIKNGIFTEAGLYRRVRTFKPILSLDSPYGKKGMMKGAGFNMVIEEALTVGYIRELVGKEFELARTRANCRRLGRLFKVTNTCLEEMKKI